MKLKVAFRLLQILPTRPEGALTTLQILDRWTQAGRQLIELRTVQRYMSELSSDGADGPALLTRGRWRQALGVHRCWIEGC